MSYFTRRFQWIGLPLCLLAGCAQNAGPSHPSILANPLILEAHGTRFARLNPGPNAVTFTAFADGRLALEDGCFRLLRKQTSLAIIWPETAILVRDRQTIRVEDHAARWSAGIGDRIRLGGKAADDINAVDLNNNAVRDCAGPYYIASNVIRRRSLF
jgi:hypothetical protein